MIEKEQSIDVMKNRLGALDEFASFKLNPTIPFEAEDLPGISIIEGPDGKIKSSSRGHGNVGDKRLAEIIIEWAVTEDHDPSIKELNKKIRKAILENPFPIIDQTTGKPKLGLFWRESHFEGPMGYGLPGVYGMRLILELYYTDVEEF